MSVENHQSAVRLVRAGALLAGRLATLLGANPEHYAAGHAVARNQNGQHVVAAWIRDEGLAPP